MKFLDELERLEKAATPGPFKVRGLEFLADENPVPHVVKEYLDIEGRRCTAFAAVYESGTLPNKANAAFDAALRNAAPALLAIARAAEEADAHIFGNRDGMPELDDWKWLTALQSALAALDGTPEGGGK